ncbi:MAG: bis(5'-nucleosyl)-tetraphosphatase (symmetrical) YqeK [Oscillospiraceae bacterium]|nr:bis(5'-nucleosyl)-tetraphosphatase (symmetrical) YqeK [Oscillospiraceae bacterium]
METLEFCRLPEEELKSVLKSRMNEHRYAHSLNVAERAVFLAKKYGADPKKAEFAGLIHDICKGIPNEEQLSIIKNAGIELYEDTLKSPALWHSIAGAVYCEHELGVTDKDVLNAVRYHTSGRGKMSILEKVIYMADLTSAERNYPDAEYTRNLTDYNLDEGIAYGVRWIAGDLERRGFPKGKDTEALFEEYKNVLITFEERK